MCLSHFSGQSGDLARVIQRIKCSLHEASVVALAIGVHPAQLTDPDAKSYKIVVWRTKSRKWRREWESNPRFQSFHFEEDGKLLSKRSPASSNNFESEPGSIPVGRLWRQEPHGPWLLPSAW